MVVMIAVTVIMLALLVLECPQRPRQRAAADDRDRAMAVGVVSCSGAPCQQSPLTPCWLNKGNRGKPGRNMRPTCKRWMITRGRSGALKLKRTTKKKLKRKKRAVTTMATADVARAKKGGVMKLKRKKRAVTTMATADVARAKKGGVMARAQQPNVACRGSIVQCDPH